MYLEDIQMKAMDIATQTVPIAQHTQIGSRSPFIASLSVAQKHGRDQISGTYAQDEFCGVADLCGFARNKHANRTPENLKS